MFVLPVRSVVRSGDLSILCWKKSEPPTANSSMDTFVVVLMSLMATESFAMASVRPNFPCLCASGVVGDSVDFGVNWGTRPSLSVMGGLWWCCHHHGFCVPLPAFVRHARAAPSSTVVYCVGAAARLVPLLACVDRSAVLLDVGCRTSRQRATDRRILITSTVHIC